MRHSTFNLMSTQAEAERIAQEKADAEAKEKEEADRIAAEKAEAERLLKEQAEAEAKKSDEADRLAAEAAKASDEADKEAKEAEEKADEAEEAVERETEGEGVLPTARNIGLGAVEQLGGVQRSVQHRARSPPTSPPSSGARCKVLAAHRPRLTKCPFASFTGGLSQTPTGGLCDGPSSSHPTRARRMGLRRPRPVCDRGRAQACLARRPFGGYTHHIQSIYLLHRAARRDDLRGVY